MSLSVLIAEWLERQAGMQVVAAAIPRGGTYSHFEFFRLIPVAYSTAKLIQLQSSMTFIHNFGCKDIDLLLNEDCDSLYYDLSA